jgi:hypothetical protein
MSNIIYKDNKTYKIGRLKIIYVEYSILTYKHEPINLIIICSDDLHKDDFYLDKDDKLCLAERYIIENNNTRKILLTNNQLSRDLISAFNNNKIKENDELWVEIVVSELDKKYHPYLTNKGKGVILMPEFSNDENWDNIYIDYINSKQQIDFLEFLKHNYLIPEKI